MLPSKAHKKVGQLSHLFLGAYNRTCQQFTNNIAFYHSSYNT